MDQGKLARDQGQDLAKQLSSQAKKNQVELQKFIHNSVAMSLDSIQRNHQNQMAEMQNQVQQMSELVVSLQRKVEDIDKK
jgi:polyhydroxyalkanoate synthesis regulator phasin